MKWIAGFSVILATYFVVLNYADPRTTNKETSENETSIVREIAQTLEKPEGQKVIEALKNTRAPSSIEKPQPALARFGTRSEHAAIEKYLKENLVTSNQKLIEYFNEMQAEPESVSVAILDALQSKYVQKQSERTQLFLMAEHFSQKTEQKEQIKNLILTDLLELSKKRILDEDLALTSFSIYLRIESDFEVKQAVIRQLSSTSLGSMLRRVPVLQPESFPEKPKTEEQQ